MVKLQELRKPLRTSRCLLFFVATLISTQQYAWELPGRMVPSILRFRRQLLSPSMSFQQISSFLPFSGLLLLHSQLMSCLISQLSERMVSFRTTLARTTESQGEVPDQFHSDSIWAAITKFPNSGVEPLPNSSGSNNWQMP